MAYRIKTIPKTTTLADDGHLITGVERFWLKAEDHRQAILWGLGLVLLAVMAIGIVIYYDHLQGEKALDLHRQATALALDRPAGQSNVGDENLKKAITMYRQVVDQYPKSATAPLALYELGNALVQAKDYSGGIEAYKKYLSSYQVSKSLSGLVHQRLAFAYLLNGDREQAAKQFAAILEMPGSLNKDQALFELGKLEEAQSRPEGALARYQDLTKTYPSSPFAAEAEVRIKALGGKKADAPETAAPEGKK